MKKSLYLILLFALLGATTACSSDKTDTKQEEPSKPDTGNDDSEDDPRTDNTIADYDGEKADDAALDLVGTDGDFYWEANTFSNTVTITYNGSEASVEKDNDNILSTTVGANVAIDLATNSVKDTEIILKGKSAEGSLKIYGDKKFKLTLSGVDLTSTLGPAINDQDKKRVFVHLTEGTTNRLTDAATYSDDIYYLAGASSDTEDRKGCFFSEGNLIFSGTGTLVVAGKKKHGIATDGYFWMRPGVTLAITEAAGNALQVKGDQDD